MEVRFENVTMSFDNRVVLNDNTFKIPEHKLTSLLGPSGSGKSTTLNLIAGLIFPTSGNIYFDEKNVTKEDALARRVGFVFQNYALYPHMTVLENIEFPLSMQKVKKEERRERAMELAKLVKIEPEINKRPGELSGGQQQRVAIARALAKRPSILLMDEPLSNLDARLRIEMREEIRRIQEETNVTTVFVTHDQAEALSISDRVMVIDQGEIQQFSESQELYIKPRNLFVAEFIGTPKINTIHKTADLPLDFVALTANQASEIETIGIRPEHFEQVDSAEEASISGEIRYIEIIGNVVTARIDTPYGELVSTSLSLENEKGDTVHLAVKPENILLFDKNGLTIMRES